MNFLAHTHLSGKSSDILFGNFIADSVKGKSYQIYRKEIQDGITLHRAIDTYTDKHPITKNSREIIRENFGKFSGIVVDIYYDHFLARNWSNYHDLELAKFSTQVYLILARRFLILPGRVKKLLPFLIAQNWLSGYANLDDLTRVFNGMDRRTGHISGMDKAVDVLESNYEALYADFHEFYPQLEAFSSKELQTILEEGN